MTETTTANGQTGASGSPVSAALFPLLLVNFIGTLGYSILLPFLVVLVIKLGGNEVIYGILGACYSLFQFIGAPILGAWSDRYGRKKILLLSQAGTFVAWVVFMIALLIPRSIIAEVDSPILGVFMLSTPLLILFFARALDGITGGNVSVANAYLADITADADKKSNFGKMAASSNLGFIIGPAFAGILGATVLEELLPVIVAMLISLIAIVVIARLLPESSPCILAKPLDDPKIKKILGQEHKECYQMLAASPLSFRDALRLPNHAYILGLYFVIFLAFNFFYVAFPVHAMQQLGWSLMKLGIFFSLLGAMMIVVQGPVLSKLSGKVSDSTLAIIGSVLLSLNFFLFMSENDVLLFVAALLFAVGNGIMWPSFLAILSRVAGRKYQGAVQGYASSAGSLASIIGLLSGGVLYGIFGTQTFLLPAFVMLLIFALALRLPPIERSLKPAT